MLEPHSSRNTNASVGSLLAFSRQAARSSSLRSVAPSDFFFRQGKGTDWTGVAQCKFKRPVVYGNFHMMIPSQQASWASYTPHILWLPFNMDISRKKRWELALNGSR